MAKQNDKRVVPLKVVHEVIGDDKIEVGQWYWVDAVKLHKLAKGEIEIDEDDEGDFDEDEEPEGSWLGCVTHVGSNYVKIEGVYGGERIHLDHFDRVCGIEPDADIYLQGQVEKYQHEVKELMGEVQKITEYLALGGQESGPEHTQALATTVVDPKEHQKALIKAKEHDLPDLFYKIEQANRAMGRWMTAPTIPLRAQAKGMEKVVGQIDDRIFHVELYAGLAERVKHIRKGEGAPMGEKLKLLQRMHFMDEECLANYEAGGMDYKSLDEFDRWLTRKDNLDRILPFPRCIVAFRIRRNEKERHQRDYPSLWHYIQIAAAEKDADQQTFLYIRNGAQVYRLSTKVDFGESLFPDLDRTKFHGKLWVKKRYRSEIIDQNRYDGLCEHYDNVHKTWKRQTREWKAAWKKAKAARKDDQYRADVERYMANKVPNLFQYGPGSKKGAREWAIKQVLIRQGLKEPSNWPPHVDNPRDTYEPFDQDSVYYDDTADAWGKELAKHNRIALILQGLFDRSAVLHPHPKVRLWTQEGFDAAVDLVYDVDRALDSGPKPDFEVFRAKCNASLKEGSITVGQQLQWERAEAEKYNKRHRGDRHFVEYKTYAPYGNPGPGLFAPVVKFSPRTGKCTYRWVRQGRFHGWPYYRQLEHETKFTVLADEILNIDGYTPGDYKQFFADHRTRAEYLRWAPLLLAAEDYHAGKIDRGPKKKSKKKVSRKK